MSVFQLGTIVKNRREELGYSQEELADGICSVPTLSRIENGERMPTKNHFEMLMQRLGYSTMSLDYFTDRREFRIHELKFKIRQAYIDKDYEQAAVMLQEFSYLAETGSKIDKQFSLLYQTLLHKGEYSTQELLKHLEKALMLTCPKYASNSLPRVISFEEIILLNNIAIYYDVLGDREQSIAILKSVKEYYDHQVICSEEALRTQPMILYNLSKYLGLNGQYDECIEVCDYAVRIARSSGRCAALAATLYNRGWALGKRNEEGDASASMRSMRQAYRIASVLGDERQIQYCEAFWRTHFPGTQLL